MGNTSTTSVNESASDLLDRWLAHRQQEERGDADQAPESGDERDAGPATEPEPEPEIQVSVSEDAGPNPDDKPEPIETVEEFEEFAHPVPALGGAPGAPSSLGPESPGEAPLAAPAPAPVATGASVPHLHKPPTPVRRPVAAPTPGLVLFSPRRGFRHLLTTTGALLAAGVGIAGFVAWEARTLISFGVAGGMLAALFLVWKLRGRTTGTQITIEDGMLRIAQGKGRHLFPLAGAHPPIDILGEPGRRNWKVLIQRRGMPPFVITRKMVEPSEFTEVIRHFRPDA